MPNRKAIISVLGLIVIEIVYKFGTQLAVHELGHGQTAELTRTALRIGATIALVFLFKALIFSKTPDKKVWGSPLFGLAVLLFLLARLNVVTRYEPTAVNWLYMGTSIFVGLHEEFLFRGIVQNWLQRIWGVKAALSSTAILFCMFHIGLLPWNILVYGQVAIGSVILGLLYLVSGNIWVAVFSHALFDVIAELHTGATVSQWISLDLWLLATALMCCLAYIRRPKGMT